MALNENTAYYNIIILSYDVIIYVSYENPKTIRYFTTLCIVANRYIILKLLKFKTTLFNIFRRRLVVGCQLFPDEFMGMISLILGVLISVKLTTEKKIKYKIKHHRKINTFLVALFRLCINIL